ncbi:MAG: methyltransferase domain-containing protein [Halapricum sp.]
MDDGGHLVLTEQMERLEDPVTYRYFSGEEFRGFLDPQRSWRVADLDSGIGLYTRELASVVGSVYAVDIDRDMHELYRTNGVAANVVSVTADVVALPFRDGEPEGGLDADVPPRHRRRVPGDRASARSRRTARRGRLVRDRSRRARSRNTPVRVFLRSEVAAWAGQRANCHKNKHVEPKSTVHRAPGDGTSRPGIWCDWTNVA